MITQDFLSSQATQSYPFLDSAYQQSKTLQFLPKFLILDVRLNLPPGVSQGGVFYLHSIQDTKAALNIYVGYAVNSRWYKIGAFYSVSKYLDMSYDINERYTTFSPIQTGVQSIDSWLLKATGSIVVGETYRYASGSLEFSYTQTPIDPQCINVYNVQQVQSIRVGDTYLTGTINLTSSNNSVVFSVSGNTININVSDTYIQKLGKSALSLITAEYGTPVSSINGVTPSSSGNISLTGLDCVQVQPAGVGTLKISNPCAKPCCTSSQNQNINAMIKVIQQAQNILRSYFVNQMNTINYMQSNLSTLMSR